MAYFAFGWPKALATGAVPESGEVVHVSLGADLLVIVFQGSIQIWTGGQHRLKIGELVRSPASLQEEGLHTKAFWCPGRKCLAALVSGPWQSATVALVWQQAVCAAMDAEVPQLKGTRPPAPCDKEVGPSPVPAD